MARLVDDLPTVRLSVGEVRLVKKPVFLQTVLGSCVAATFWSPSLLMGAMCHGALPRCPESVLREGDQKVRLRYVDYAIRHLLNQFCSLGAPRFQLEIKLFGGADVLPLIPPRGSASVGQQNCLAAVQTLDEEALSLTSSDLGGRQGRVIYFRTDTGEVLLRRLPSSEVAEAERAALAEALADAGSRL